MGKPLAELRLFVAYQGGYASVGYITLDKKGDIYSGPRGSWFQRNGIPELFRHSYHRDGRRFHRLLGGPEWSGVSTPPEKITGLVELGQVSPTMPWVEFEPDHPKADSANRRSLILNGEDFFPDTFTAHLFAVEPGKLNLVTEQENSLKDSFKFLGSVVADWCNPNLAIVAFALTSDQLSSFERAIAESGA